MRLVAHSAYHCSCGFAVNDPDLFGDHLREVFERPDESGIDGRVHDELDLPADPERPLGVICSCGYVAADPAEFDDHALLMLLPPDAIGNDGDKHTLTDPSTPPPPWIVPEPPGQ